MKCNNDYFELIVATTDKNLYDNLNKEWKYDLYIGINCLYNLQYNISDNIKPNLKPSQYIKLDTNPQILNYCNLPKCNSSSTTFNIVFTFDPTSDNPQDYLQYVFNSFGEITDIPSHSIKDSNNNNFYLSINLNNSLKNKYIELWLTKNEIPTYFQLSNLIK